MSDHLYPCTFELYLGNEFAFGGKCSVPCLAPPEYRFSIKAYYPYDTHTIRFEIPSDLSEGLSTFATSIHKTIRFYHNKKRAEGMFVCKFLEVCGNEVIAIYVEGSLEVRNT